MEFPKLGMKLYNLEIYTEERRGEERRGGRYIYIDSFKAQPMKTNEYKICNDDKLKLLPSYLWMTRF
jgi:hypothetical protein